jgi:hypothetical protein
VSDREARARISVAALTQTVLPAYGAWSRGLRRCCTRSMPGASSLRHTRRAGTDVATTPSGARSGRRRRERAESRLGRPVNEATDRTRRSRPGRTSRAARGPPRQAAHSKARTTIGHTHTTSWHPMRVASSVRQCRPTRRWNRSGGTLRRRSVTALRLTESVTYPRGTLQLSYETAGAPTYGNLAGDD